MFFYFLLLLVFFVCLFSPCQFSNLFLIALNQSYCHRSSICPADAPLCPPALTCRRPGRTALHGKGTKTAILYLHVPTAGRQRHRWMEKNETKVIPAQTSQRFTDIASLGGFLSRPHEVFGECGIARVGCNI